MQTRDLKYLLAYFVPLSAVCSLYFQGVWSWATMLFVFGAIPIMELLAPVTTTNHAEAAETERTDNALFDWLLYLNAPILYGIVAWYLWIVAFQNPDTSTWWGLTMATGIVVGTCGINVAHELGHRRSRGEQNLAKWMLLPALYQHFFVEHNWGHHKNVATDLDPASARKGEILFVFWIKSVVGGWRNAWALESERLKKAGQSTVSFQNQMLRFSIYQAGWLLAVYLLTGSAGLLGAIAVAVVGFLLLETVNYLEHYGLRRKKLPSGHYEPVTQAHSWNSDHEIGRILLYELTRHSDHHFKSTRKYQILRHLDESPQLPFGYPTSVLLCLVPPLWFAIMNKRV